MKAKAEMQALCPQRREKPEPYQQASMSSGRLEVDNVDKLRPRAIMGQALLDEGLSTNTYRKVHKRMPRSHC